MSETIQRQEVEKELQKLESQFNGYGISFEAGVSNEKLAVHIHWIKGFMPYGPETVELFAGKLLEAAQAVREFKYAGCRVAD